MTTSLDVPDTGSLSVEPDSEAACTESVVPESESIDQRDNVQLGEEDLVFFNVDLVGRGNEGECILCPNHTPSYSIYFFVPGYHSSSSEYEEEVTVTVPLLSELPDKKDEQSYTLVRWFIIFVRLWQIMFNISDAAIKLLLKFVSTFFKLLATLTSLALIKNIASQLPPTLYLLRKYLQSDKQSFVKYTICPSCFSLYEYADCISEDETGEQTPKRCTYIQFPNHPQRNRRLPCNAALMTKVNLSGGKVKYIPRFSYAYQPIEQSLQKLLFRPGFSEQLEHWRTRTRAEGYISDIYDGEMWNDFNSCKHSNFLHNKRCYGLMLNFDFFQPYKHTTDSYGVFYMTLMNLPRDQRFKQENVLLVGIIPAFEHEPTSLNSFMKPMVAELKQFWSPGVRLFTAESPKFKLQFKLALMCTACDIPAARKVCGFMGHNANRGCSRCLKFFPGGFEKKDFSGFARDTWPTRKLADHKITCNNLKKCKSLNERTSMESRTGIKYSILTELPYFDPIRFTIVDPMHNLFLGTAKHMMKIWTENGLITKDQMKVVQTRVDSIRVPSGIGRVPKKISSSFAGFTAEQWKNWVMLYSMFALRGILPQEHYVCWQTFVLSCFFLCRRQISDIELKKADLLLLKFCKKVQELYGPHTVTPNMHLHCHLAECVRDYGSVYSFWLFSYERYNGTLGSYPTNKRNTTEQLMHRFVYDAESFQLPLPDTYREQFQDTLPLHNLVSDIHQHQPEQCPNDSFLEHATLSSIYKFRSLNPQDYEKLKSVYAHLYPDEIIDDHMVRTIQVYKTITYYKQHLGSLRCPSTVNSSFIMASWAGSSGSIGNNDTLRPGKVLFYFVHQFKEGNAHLFAAVYWYKDHPCHSLYGKPLEVWSEGYIPEGPAMFLPIHMLVCRCTLAQAMIPLPDNKEEKVTFISPLPTLKFF